MNWVNKVGIVAVAMQGNNIDRACVMLVCVHQKQVCRLCTHRARVFQGVVYSVFLRNSSSVLDLISFMSHCVCETHCDACLLYNGRSQS